MRRLQVLVAALGLAAVVSAAGTSAAPRPKVKRLVVAGSITDVMPGAARWMRVSVRNPNRRPVRLIRLDVQPRAAGACSAANLRVDGYRGRLVIRARRTSVVRLRVRMATTLWPACEGARFPLAFTARGTMR